MNNKNIFITSPLFYTNGKLHIGHLYTIIIVDVISRYKESLGYNVYLQTGSDEHGEKVLKKSIALNIKTQDLTNEYVNLSKKLFQNYNIFNYSYYRTSDYYHKNEALNVFNILLKKGYIFLDKYQGKYCITCEDYINERESEYCKACGNDKLDYIEEEAYFLKIIEFKDFLLDFYKKNNIIIPNFTEKELLKNFLSNEIKDLCITRKNLPIGIIVDKQKNLTLYVWFEALLNYILSIHGKEAFSDKNYEIIHIIGKDIVRFHGIYLPIIIKMLNLERSFDKIIAHGWIIDKSGKMSKSKGNIIDPSLLIDKFSPEVIKSYFIMNFNIERDSIFEEKNIEEFKDSFLKNKLGNLVSRFLNLLKNNILVSNDEPIKNKNILDYKNDCFLIKEKFLSYMNEYKLNKAYVLFKKTIDLSNELINIIEPWKINKKDKLFNSFAFNLLNGIKLITLMMKPILLTSYNNIIKMFNFNKEWLNWDNCLIYNKKIEITTENYKLF